MRSIRAIATGLLLVALLSPVLGASVCVYQSVTATASCEMSTPGSTSEHHQHPGTPTPCADMPICATTVATLPALAEWQSVLTSHEFASYTSPPRLQPAEPQTPPQPPPIA